MAERSKLLSRNQPDALAKLCFRHGERVIKSVRADGGENNKVKLIQYYMGLNGKWSRDKEKRDWKGSNLASLKYETYRFVIQVLAQAGDSRNSDLYSDIKEIASAIQIGAYSYALEICNTSLPIAIEREEYSLAVHILDLRDEILDDLDFHQKLIDAKDQYGGIRKEMVKRLNEVHRFAELRRDFLEPLKQQWIDSEMAPMDQVEAIQTILAENPLDAIQSPTARVDLLSLSIFFATLKGDHKEASRLTGLLLSEYENSKILKKRQPKRYIHHLRLSTLLFTQLGEEKPARKALSGLLGALKKFKEYSAQIYTAWIYCALRISSHFNDPKLMSKAILVFEQHEKDIQTNIEEGEQLRIQWALMIGHLKFDAYKYAYRVGQKLLNRKSSIRRTLLLNTRIAVFACEIALYPNEKDRIEGSYKANYQFIDRNIQLFPEAFEVLRSFRSLWLCIDKKTPIPPMQVEGVRSGGLFDFSDFYQRLAENFKCSQ